MLVTYTVRAIPIAELPVPEWECVFGHNDCNCRNLIFYVWLIEGGGKTILVDAGPPPDSEDFERLRLTCQSIDPKSTLKRRRTLEEILAQTQVNPNSIDFVLITQAITYCTGGLVDPLFSNAKVYLSRAGMLEFLMENPGHPPRTEYFTRSTWSYLYQCLIDNRLVLTDDCQEVLDGIWFETTGGHHPGSAAVKIRTQKGLIGILETAFVQENLDTGHPIGVAENAALCRQVIRRYVEECDLVIAGHDETLLERFPGGLIA